ncbi:hypothetical protein OESDEN_21858, partial [Oesophagostomum dentatum]
HNAVIEALIDAGVDPGYIKIIQDCYKEATTTIKLFEREIVIPVKRGVRQGDTISPKVFIITLQYAMKDLNWEKYGIWIDGKNITNLRFADDIVLCAKNPEEAQKMLDDLDKTSKAVGLEMNKKKTQYMKNAWCP